MKKGRADSEEDAAQDQAEAIGVRLDTLLAERNMTLTELSGRVGVSIVNLSVLKNGRARAIRFSTLARLCEVLGCQPGDLLSYHAREPGQNPAGASSPGEAGYFGVQLSCPCGSFVGTGPWRPGRPEPLSR